MKLALDIFCGSGSFGNVAKQKGFEVISLDNRRRKGTCEPTIKSDITELDPYFFSSLKPSILWAGLPCDIWSNASGGFHLDNNFNPKTEKAKKHLDIFFKTIEIIKNTNSKFFFIENPRGKLQHFPPLIDFTKETKSTIYNCTLSSYGFPTTKPTIIISNFPNLKLLKMDPFGRGHKNKNQESFDNMTKVQRQKTPKKLIESIINQVNSNLSSK